MSTGILLETGFDVFIVRFVIAFFLYIYENFNLFPDYHIFPKLEDDCRAEGNSDCTPASSSFEASTSRLSRYVFQVFLAFFSPKP